MSDWSYKVISGACALVPGHSIAVDLQELEDVLSFLPVLGFLFGRQRIIRHQQGMVPAS